MLELENILLYNQLDLQSNKNFLKEIRNGEYSLEYLEGYFKDKEEFTEKLLKDTKLPYKIDEVKVREILIKCLEDYYEMPISYFLG
jgi:hypothetical protein